MATSFYASTLSTLRHCQRRPGSCDVQCSSGPTRFSALQARTAMLGLKDMDDLAARIGSQRHGTLDVGRKHLQLIDSGVRTSWHGHDISRPAAGHMLQTPCLWPQQLQCSSQGSAQRLSCCILLQCAQRLLVLHQRCLGLMGIMAVLHIALLSSAIQCKLRPKPHSVNLHMHMGNWQLIPLAAAIAGVF